MPAPIRAAALLPPPPSARRVASAATFGTATVLAGAAVASRVSELPSSDVVALDITGAVGNGPDTVHAAVELATEAGVVVLVAAVLWAAWRARGSVPAALGRLLAGGIGAVAAYAASEVLKVVAAQPRPCQELVALASEACPPPGDWSLPSNHAVIAAGLATALVLAVPRWWLWLVPVAAAVLVTRVALGVHYPHDVLTGALLAVGVVTGSVLLLDGPAGRAVAAVAAHPRLGRVLRRDG